MRKRTYLKLVEHQEEQARRHLEEVRSVYKEMRGYKHDFHHHLQTLKLQLESGQTQRAIAYLQQLDETLQSVDGLIKTGNIIVDAIFSAKLARAREEGVETSVKATVPGELTLSDLELSIVLGNLLDNALEASREAEERYMRIFLGMKGGMLYFHMLNSAGGKKLKNGPLFLTSKAGAHGFGLYRAQAILKEHGGWCKFNSEDGAFTSEFLVPALPESGGI